MTAMTRKSKFPFECSQVTKNNCMSLAVIGVDIEKGHDLPTDPPS